MPQRLNMFNYTEALENLIRDIVQRMGEFQHVDPDRLLVAWTRSRNNGPVGAYAKIVPLRFEAGAQERRVGRHTYEMPGLIYRGRELLYLLYFYMPRFGDLPYRQGLETVLHELYHISPRFDGDIRRFPGRNFAHGSSQKRFDTAVAQLTERYLSVADPAAAAFLRSSTAELTRTHGSLIGRRIPLPRPMRKG